MMKALCKICGFDGGCECVPGMARKEEPCDMPGASYVDQDPPPAPVARIEISSKVGHPLIQEIRVNGELVAEGRTGFIIDVWMVILRKAFKAAGVPIEIVKGRSS